MGVDVGVLKEVRATLEERCAGIGGAHELAALAGVGPSTLRKVRKLAEYWSAAPPADDEVIRKECGRKLWDSIVRLARVCERDPEGWLSGFGVDETAVRGAVADRARGVRASGARRRAGVADLVAHIERAAGARQRIPTVRVGLLHWEPFNTLALPAWPAESREARGDRPGIECSMGAWWVRKAIGSLAPELREFTFERVERVDELLTGLGIRGGPRRWDVAVGLFDLPQRRRTGLWFSGIPGFCVKLGAIHFSPTGAAPVPPWEQIASPDRAAPQRVHHVLSVREEASWLFLRGATRYPPEKVHEAESLRVDGLIQAGAGLAARLRVDPDGVGGPEEAARSFVLVCDEETVLRTLRAFETLKAAVLEGRTDVVTVEAGPVGAGPCVLKLTPELASFARYSAREIPDQFRTRPRYEATLCFPPGEERLYRLVRWAKRHELFGPAVEDTSRLLADFFAEAARASGATRPVRVGTGLEWMAPEDDPRSMWSPKDGFYGEYLQKSELAAAFCKHLLRRLTEIVGESAECLAWRQEAEARVFHGVGERGDDRDFTRRPREIAKQIARWLVPEEWRASIPDTHPAGF